MNKTFLTVALMLAISFNAFSQQPTYRLTSSDSYREIKFEANKGAGESITLEAKIEWKPGENLFTVLFKNDTRDNKGKYICFFPKTEKMSVVKKSHKELSFDAKLKKGSKDMGVPVVYGFLNKSGSGNDVLIFDLGKEDSFGVNFKEDNEFKIKPNLNFELYVYTANLKGKKNKNIRFLSVIHFEVELSTGKIKSNDSSKCSCNCSELKRIVNDELGNLYMKIDNANKDNTLNKNKSAFKQKLQDIKKSIKCIDDCERCTKEYKSFQKICKDIETLLK